MHQTTVRVAEAALDANQTIAGRSRAARAMAASASWRATSRGNLDAVDAWRERLRAPA
jgi:hypothetical protein